MHANIDGIREFRLFGWACGAAPGEEEIVLLRGDDPVPVPAPVRRVPRADAAAALGQSEVRLGFEIDLPPTLWAGRAANDVVTLSVQVDGQRLPARLALAPADIAALVDLAAQTADGDRRRTLIQRALFHLRSLGTTADLDARQRATLAEVTGANADPLADHPPLAPPFSAQVESSGALLVTGWLLGARPGAEHVELLCEGEPVPTAVQRTQRRDVALATGTSHLDAGFEIEIPGAVWRGHDRRARLHIGLRADGFPFGPTLVLERVRLAAQLRAAMAQASDTTRRRHVLLALEHIAEAGGAGALANEDERRLARQAARDEGVAEEDADAPAPPWTPARPQARGRWTRWLERRHVADAAFGMLDALRRLGHRWPTARRRAEALERWLLLRTGLFHKRLYQQQRPGDAPGSALRHYVEHGAAQGLLPVALFDPRRYAGQMPGRRPPEMAPVLHYALRGRFEGLAPSAWFDTRFYLERNPDVRASGVNPLRHFMEWGWRDGRAPYPGFSPENAARQRVELRMARRGLAPAESLLGYLLAGLPPQRSLPRGQQLPWWPVPTLDGVDWAAPARWEALRARAPATGPVVDVLVPVYAGIQETLSCLHSVLTSRNAAAFELVVIDDTSPEPALSAHLRELAGRGLLTLHANASNLGFVRTVNRGLALHPDRDVVILNSDTVVYDGWLDRLLAHAASDVASVTPLSNNATLCSYPLASAENWAPLEVDHAELDRIAAAVNPGLSVGAPTGVGFCMLMTRRALDAVGLLDEEHFGRGYGEENDWCQRADGLGLRNRLAADVYVRHRGSVSFGGEADERMQSVLDTLEGLHPGYLDRIAVHAASDGLAQARVRMDVARLVRADPRPRVLSVSHARGGGTERAEATRTRRWQAGDVDVAGLRPGWRPGTIAIVPSAPLLLPNLREIPLGDDAALAALFASLNVTAVQIHHLVDFPAGFRPRLLTALARLGIAPDVMVHDYHAICPRINLVDRSGRWCGERGPAQCDACLGDGGLPEPVASIADWRAGSLAVLQAARTVEVPDQDVADRLCRYFPMLAPTVVPHEAPIPRATVPAPRTSFDAGRPARVLVIGALSVVKGFDVVRDLAAWAGRSGAPLRLELLGFSHDDPALAAAGVAVHGRYDDLELAARIDTLAPDLILVPSVWPETYCYVLSAALASGRRTAVFDLGAQGRRLHERGGGLLLPLALALDPAGLGGAVLAFLHGGTI